MMKEILSLRPCPWCKKTPQFIMFLHYQTWLPKIMCQNSECLVEPSSKHVSIRKKQKYQPTSIRDKIIKLFNSWNIGNDQNAYEGKEFDWVQIVKDEIKHHDGDRNNLHNKTIIIDEI